MYREHGNQIDLEIDLLLDTIIKILTVNFDKYCCDKNQLREALIIDIIGVIHAINLHNIDSFKDELCENNTLQTLLKVLYVDSPGVKESFWK